jgi:carboxypeptidase family protein
MMGTLLLAQSQSTTGTIQGIVTDPTGAGVPNANITIKNAGTGLERTVNTDAEGRFQAPLLDPGAYDVTVSATGFATQVSRGYNLTLGQALIADQALKVATGVETVTVDAQAPVVETTNSQTGTLVNSAAVANLPLNGRRFLDLAQLTPGVMVEPERNQISFAGSRGINSAINIDGSNFNEPFFGGQAGGERSGSAYVVSQAAVDQFQVVRGTFDPEYGRATGGSVNVITKSGTNDYHGELFNYLRLANISPKTAFGDRVTDFRDQYGGSIGGPIKKDKLFFFAVYDGQREHAPLIIRFNSTAGLPPDYLAQQGVYESTNNINTFLAKSDWQISPKHRASFRYNQSGDNALNGTYIGVQTGVIANNGTEQDFSHAGVASLISTFSPTLLNEARFQYRIEDRPRVNNGEGMDFVNKAGPQTQVSGCCFFGGVSFLPIPVTSTTIQFTDSMTWIHGGHTIKFGVDVNRYHTSEVFRGNWRGVYIFNNIANFTAVLNKTPGAVPDQFRIFYGDGIFAATVSNPAGFIQDSWKINRRVTLSGGLRYEAYLEPTPPRPNAALPATAQVPSDLKEFQPRVGLAVDLTGDGKTVLRAGAGMFYAGTPSLLLNQVFNSSGNTNVGISFTLNPAQIAAVQSVHPEFVYPFVPTTNNAADSVYFSNSGVAGLKPNASFFSPDFQNPRSVNFTAGLERQLTGSMSIAVDWVHSNTVHLERIRDINLFLPVVGPDNSTPPQLRPIYTTANRPNPNYGQLLSQQSSARSNYDALTISLNKRLSRHLQFLINGTLSYNRDDDSNERNFSGITYDDAYNLAQEYTWSRDDIRRRMVASALYDLPLGFQLSGIMTWRSGLPFSPFTNVDSNQDSNFTDRPIVGGVLLGRDSFRQPNFWSTDLRVLKDIKITERHRVDLMVDMFNAFNHENFTYQVSTNESTTSALGSRWGTSQTPLPTFRTIRLPNGSLNVGGAAVASPIQLQFAMRYRF